MKRAISFLVLGFLAFMLAGCVASTPVDSLDLQATFTVSIASEGPQPKIAVRAIERADVYRWDFDDGTIIEGGRDKAVVSHTYSEVGVYVVVLTVTREGTGTGGSAPGGGCCGPPPGVGPPGSGGGSTPGEDEVASSFKIVNFAGCWDLVPILISSTWQGGYITSTFYPGQRVCLNAQESRGEGLTYRIEIVRVVSKNDPTPIPYPWKAEPEYILTDSPLYCFYIAGSGACEGETWTFRVTLRIRDKNWREATVTKYIYSTCCP